ncbi:mannose-6-phosphate isomerase [Nocardioides hungaricus]
MQRLDGAVRRYEWGSRTLLPRFLGAEPDGGPYAELWLGAHPGDPAMLPDGTTLADLIARRPGEALGAEVAQRFDGHLPFLMKALAAAEPLSLQVHPTAQRARQGFAREEAAGIPVGAPDRSYQDESHKPELIVALTRFEGMAGFRDVAKSAAILRLLDLPWADATAAQLTEGDPGDALHAVVAEMLAMPGDRIAGLLAEIGAAARRAEDDGHRRRTPSSRIHRDRDSVEREATRVFAQTPALAARYPHDPGVLVTLLLNHVILRPGEAMFLDAGVVHAYTSGFGVEIMAASDNVVRAGLTPKHVDVPELLEIADFRPMPPPLWTPAEEGAALAYAPPVAEFGLHLVDAPASELPVAGPRIVLVLDGEVTVASGTDTRTLTQGSAVFVGYDEGAIELGGAGRVAIGAVPPRSG